MPNQRNWERKHKKKTIKNKENIKVLRKNIKTMSMGISKIGCKKHMKLLKYSGVEVEKRMINFIEKDLHRNTKVIKH